MSEQVYAGFWIRVAASLIDTVCVMVILVPLMLMLFGSDIATGAEEPGALYYLVTYLLPAAAVIVFWVYRSATPGKLILGIEIVDAATGARPSTAQFIGRYLGYYVSTIPLMLGFVWVALDARKQGWHDKLARTVVVYRQAAGAAAAPLDSAD